MKRGYGQYCPLALTTELLGQRWMILVVSRLIDGCTTFNEIHRGVPRISPSLLSQRLSELESAGLMNKIKREGKRTFSYQLTDAGWALEDIVMQMAVWGQEWARDMTLDDLDPAFLAWSMHVRINSELMPEGRTVLEFDFSGAPKGHHRFWLVNTDGKVDMCLKYPGFDSDIVVHADLRVFVEAWRGFRDLKGEINAGRIKLEGPSALKRAFPDWLMLSALAPYRRKRLGKERRLSTASVK
ncbi:MAG: winged helix-turn-helix transcriptional regulator [Rhodothermales bacterium]